MYTSGVFLLNTIQKEFHTCIKSVVQFGSVTWAVKELGDIDMEEHENDSLETI